MGLPPPLRRQPGPPPPALRRRPFLSLGHQPECRCAGLYQGLLSLVLCALWPHAWLLLSSSPLFGPVRCPAHKLGAGWQLSCPVGRKN